MKDTTRLPSPVFTESISPSLEPGGAAPEPATEAGSWRKKVFQGPHGLRAGWRLLIFIAIFCTLHDLVFSSPWPFGHGKGGDFTVDRLLPEELVEVVLVFLATALMAKVESRSFVDYGLPWSRAFQANFWEGVAWGFVAVSVLLLGITATHGWSLTSIALHGRMAVFYAAAWGVLFLAVGFFEEFLLRGYALFTLTTGIGFWPSAILLSAAFAFMHLPNQGETGIGALQAGLIGLFSCLTLRRTGDLWFAIGFHAAWDWGETFFYGVPNSGLVAPGHFLNSSFQGPRWLTGGSAGPEGSVLALILVAVLWVLLTLRFPEARYPNPASPGSQRPRG